ncbi:FAD binding domain-containing protein [Xylariaceae sp. FL0594]|nr:FAD binding domain-containing protein [Xylariaceae sp. FL0594]
MPPQEVDVLIIGGGSAGLCAGVWLARAGVSFRILERREGRLAIGQADGVQVRTVEIFESLGISEELLKESYHVLEDAFWAPVPTGDGCENEDENGVDDEGKGKGKPAKVKGGIRRTHSAPDTEAGLSHMPHVILNQARINALLTDEIEKAAAAGTGRHKDGSGTKDEDIIEYGCEVQDVEIDTRLVGDPDAYCVTVTAVKDGVKRVYKAKYALAGDGAHSRVRKALGIKMVGESSDEVWGVMDVYPRTDFPDIRKKAIIKSRVGNIVLIPREGDFLARFYIELPPSASTSAKATAKDITLSQLHAKAAEILHPYELEIAETAWWSAYVIGQRLAESFHAHHRVFLAGDACHTHSPKAGQGMNVSLQDGFNIGWKLASVLTGRVNKGLGAELLKTYVLEREATARDLIEFDRYFSKLFSTSSTKETKEVGKEKRKREEEGNVGAGGGITPELFIKAGRYTAGLETHYADSLITTSASTNRMAKNLTVGMRFPGAQVVRVCDARHMPLTRALLASADLRWHVVVFGGEDFSSSRSPRMRKLSTDLTNLVRAFSSPAPNSNPNPNSNPPTISPNPFNIPLILPCNRSAIAIELVPSVFTPTKNNNKWGIKDTLNIFVDDEGLNNAGHGRAYERVYGVDAKRGAIVVVRPDGYISRIGALEDVEGLESFFGRFMKRSG